MVHEDVDCLFRRGEIVEGTRQAAKALARRSNTRANRAFIDRHSIISLQTGIARQNGPAGAALGLLLTLSILRLQSMQDTHIALVT
jgi:hypothetical protein